jgi:hypothetical protein
LPSTSRIECPVIWISSSIATASISTSSPKYCPRIDREREYSSKAPALSRRAPADSSNHPALSLWRQ